MDLVGAFVDRQDAGISAVLFEFVTMSDTGNTANLFCGINYAVQHFTGIILGNGRFRSDRCGVVMIKSANQFIGNGLGSVMLGGHLADQVQDPIILLQLVLANKLTGLFQNLRGHRGGADRETSTTDVQGLECVDLPAALDPDDVFPGDPNRAKTQFVGG